MIDKNRLEQKCSTWNISLTGTQLDQLDAFAEILVEYNQEQFNDNSLFECLQEEAKVRVASSEKRIELCRATAEEAKLMKVKKGTPLLYIKSVTYTYDREPLYAGVQLFNGETCSFYVCESIEQ